MTPPLAQGRAAAVGLQAVDGEVDDAHQQQSSHAAAAAAITTAAGARTRALSEPWPPAGGPKRHRRLCQDADVPQPHKLEAVDIAAHAESGLCGRAPLKTLGLA
eukprot:CAMPEP_0171112902 /NCGR_PEP_ID=MMETSP0766_2-20121228/80665_1 /TAXON_ID=439317 /ORGANISM="Gambierdiscus australes, Strain CAWD 149" /LENGTH=103 /DNA_ID=CAMNT_0011575063 /DNA_START=21 /DNA_END=329 /DNA_ORIENTATION=+